MLDYNSAIAEYVPDCNFTNDDLAFCINKHKIILNLPSVFLQLRKKHKFILLEQI